MGAVAARHGVPFIGIWLDCPPELLERRAPGQRRAIIDPPDDWVRLDASLDADMVTTAALAVCRTPEAGV
jgi:predicted kinase